MSNAMQCFGFEGTDVRVAVGDDGSPWWVAADVCSALGVKDAAMATRNLLPQEKGTSTIGTPGGNQEMLMVSESGLYALIFKSRKPEAVRFRLWVTTEVLPSIRKTGSYVAPQSDLVLAKLDTITNRLDAIESRSLASVDDDEVQMLIVDRIRERCRNTTQNQRDRIVGLCRQLASERGRPFFTTSTSARVKSGPKAMLARDRDIIDEAIDIIWRVDGLQGRLGFDLDFNQ